MLLVPIKTLLRCILVHGLVQCFLTARTRLGTGRVKKQSSYLLILFDYVLSLYQSIIVKLDLEKNVSN